MINKFFHSTFDFFSHALPGTCIAVSLYLLDPRITSVEEIISTLDKLDIGAGIFLLTVGYILGFAIYPLGRALYKWLGARQLYFEVKEGEINVSEKYSLIRELSPTNFKYVETWNMFCVMAHNLAIGCLGIIVMVIIKAFYLLINDHEGWYFWLLALLPLSGIFSLLIHRAIVFSNWARIDINATIGILNLEERARNLPESD